MCFHLYDILQNANSSLLSESRSVGVGGDGRETPRERDIKMAVISLAVVASRALSFVRTHQTDALNRCSLLYVNYTSIKWKNEGG